MSEDESHPKVLLFLVANKSLMTLNPKEYVHNSHLLHSFNMYSVTTNTKVYS